MNVEQELEIMNLIQDVQEIEKKYSEDKLKKIIKSVEFLLKENEIILNNVLKNYQSDDFILKMNKIIKMKDNLFSLQKKSELFLLHLKYINERKMLIEALSKI